MKSSQSQTLQWIIGMFKVIEPTVNNNKLCIFIFKDLNCSDFMTKQIMWCANYNDKKKTCGNAFNVKADNHLLHSFHKYASTHMGDFHTKELVFICLASKNCHHQAVKPEEFGPF